MEDERVKNALLKCATGMSADEVVEEYAVCDGELKLVKRKVTKRDIPPDIKAVKLLMDGQEEISDDQLVAERERLIAMLKDGGID